MPKRLRPTQPPADEPDIPIRGIRGERVVLDADLAAIYGVPTSRFNEAIKRNLARFPADFLFQLTREEAAALTSQNAILKAGGEAASLTSQFAISKPHRGGRRSLPYAFTEHGALQAANVLKSERAVAMSVFVIRAFVRLRAELSQSAALAAKLAELDRRLTGRLDTHERAIVHFMRKLVEALTPKPPAPDPCRPRIGFQPWVRTGMPRYRSAGVP